MEYIASQIHQTIKPLAEVEKETILNAMILCRGQYPLAVECLGISRSKLYRRLAKYRKEEN